MLVVRNIASCLSNSEFISVPVFNTLSKYSSFLLFAKSISKNSPKFTALPPASHQSRPLRYVAGTAKSEKARQGAGGR